MCLLQINLYMRIRDNPGQKLFPRTTHKQTSKTTRVNNLLLEKENSNAYLGRLAEPTSSTQR